MHTCVSSVTMKRAYPVDLLSLQPRLMEETHGGEQSPAHSKASLIGPQFRVEHLLEAYIEHPKSTHRHMSVVVCFVAITD